MYLNDLSRASDVPVVSTQMQPSNIFFGASVDLFAFDRAVESIYRAAEGKEPWPGVLQRVADGFDGLGCQFVSMNRRTGVWNYSQTNTRWPAELALEYVSKYHAVDPRVPRLLERAPGEWLYCQDEFGSEAADLEYYRDLLIPYGGRYTATMKVVHDDDELILLGLTSRIELGPFNTAQRAFIDRVGIHLRQAISLYRRYRELHHDASVGTTLIVRVAKPIFVVKRDRTVATQNTAATALLEQTDSPIRIVDGRLVGTQSPFAEALDDAIQSLLEGDEHRQDRFIALGTELRRRWLAVGISFLRPAATMSAFGVNEKILLTVYPREFEKTVEPSILQAALSLTRAEARVASAIYGGDSIRDAAQSMGIAETTAKTHLMSIFNKTGVSKQSELVRLIASLATA